MTDTAAASEDADRAALEAVLPGDLERRAEILDGAARHLHLLREVNQHLNLTRIVDPEEAAVKHVLDSLLGLAHLGEARSLLDLGTGAGFPGVPLALARPELEVHLVESVKKKAAALLGFVEALGLERVQVHPVRAEDFLRDRAVDLVVARAAGSAEKLLRLLRPVRARWRRLLLYKGPGAADEQREAQAEARRMGLRVETGEAIRLPGDRGERRFLVYARD